MEYSKRLSLLHALCLAETRSSNQEAAPSANLDDYDPLEAATYLACYISFQAIQQAQRSPADERYDNFEMLSVYQAFGMLAYAYLTLPLGAEQISPDIEQDSVIIAKSLFSELTQEELVDVIESGMRKFRLIGDAEAEHWNNYREDLDKAVVAFLVAGTDENSPFDKEDLLPVFGALLSMLCEAFA
ncbi:MAG TPA: hypothetical protein VK974_08695 [Methylophilaceae bacterium]|nr:hypothetical protein [Methylophilaceae bacterium]